MNVLNIFSYLSSRNIQKLPLMRQYLLLKCFSSSVKHLSSPIRKKLRSPRKHLSPILKKELDLSDSETLRFFKTGALETLDKNSLTSRLSCLQEMGFEKEDIKSELAILLVPSNQIQSRKLILEECGIPEITTKIISRHDYICQKPISVLKLCGILPQDLNVPENILSFAGSNIPPANFPFLRASGFLSLVAKADALTLGDLHKYVILHYLAWLLNDQDVLKKRRLFKPKSLRQVLQTYQILQTNFNLHDEQLKTYLCLSECDTARLKHLIQSYPQIGGEDLKQLVQKHPKVAFCSASDVQAVIHCVQGYGLSERTIASHPSILTMNITSLRQGLHMLKGIPDLWALRYSDSILRLLCQKQLIARLQYFKSLPKKIVPTVHLLSCPRNMIQRALNRTHSRRHVIDYLHLLSAELRKDVATIKSIISRHPYWRLGSGSEMLETLTFLRSCGFRDKDIVDNLQILLYSKSYVQSKLEETMPGKLHVKIPSRTSLAMCLYLIEKEHAFTGEGIGDGADQPRRKAPIINKCSGRPCQRDCATNPLCGKRFPLSENFIKNLDKEPVMLNQTN